jgi:hypothetical protein
VTGGDTFVRGTRVITESLHFSLGGKVTMVAHDLYAGDRRRSERIQPPATAFEIERRDLGQRIRIFAAEHKFQRIPLFDVANEEQKEKFLRSGRHWRRLFQSSEENASRTLTIRFDYNQTGDEQSMFGCTARRWIIRRRDEPDAGAGKNHAEAITESWYLDLAETTARYTGFSPELVHPAFCYAKSGNERVVIKHSGQRPSGLCAYSETKSVLSGSFKDGERQERTDSATFRVLDIAQEDFSPSLFEVPKGFRDIPVYPNRLTMARWNWHHLFRRRSLGSA